MGLIERIGGRLTYLDANVFVYVVEEVPRYLGALQPVIGAVRRDELGAVTSEITLAEVLVHPFRESSREREASFVRAIRPQGGLRVAPVSRAVLIEAARLRATFAALRLPDAIHAATARLTGCGVLLTNDAGVPALPGLEVVRLAEVV